MPLLMNGILIKCRLWLTSELIYGQGSVEDNTL